jgi:nitrate reductase gamma subunit
MKMFAGKRKKLLNDDQHWRRMDVKEMKKCIVGIGAVLVLLSFSIDSQAEWFIEDERFHASVHGQLSCRDCHADVYAKKPHPDPGAVNRSLDDFFSQDKCLSCHEDIIEDIDQGQHAGKDDVDAEAYANCIACHDPHYQMSAFGDVTPDDLKQDKEKKCALCHAFQDALPELMAEDLACMTCHQAFSADHPDAVEKAAALCFHCHGAESLMAAPHHGGQTFINIGDYKDTPHSKVSCLACHTRAADYGHADQPTGDCTQCHVRHHEKVAHEAHAAVSCGACHLWGVQPRKDPASGVILWTRQRDPSGFSRIHSMPALMGDASCMRCHFNGNAVGASAMVLPAKSIICMPCHTATFSVGDTTTLLALIVFAVGLLGAASIWFSAEGRRVGHDNVTRKAALGRKFWVTAKTLLLDGLLQRRLFRASRKRWVLHALVFFPIMFRFAWGLTALILSRWHPEGSIAWPMVDKNHPLTAFLFDLSGLLIIVGVLGMILGRLGSDSSQKPTGLPGPDLPAFVLLGGIMVVGFILEGMRMAMTGNPGGAAWAFAGHLIGRGFAGYNLAGIYGYVWYLHAILTGVFVAYLPFSRMLHMFAAPVVMAMNATTTFHKD